MISNITSQIVWGDAAVQSAIIGAIATILAAVFASICAALIGHQIAGRKRLHEKLETAYCDIDFLLAVEAEHCAKNVIGRGTSHKLLVREAVRKQGYKWSQQNTPGRR